MFARLFACACLRVDRHGTAMPPEDLALLWATCGAYADAIVGHFADPTIGGHRVGLAVQVAHRIAHNCACARLLRVNPTGFPLLTKGTAHVALPAALK